MRIRLQERVVLIGEVADLFGKLLVSLPEGATPRSVSYLASAAFAELVHRRGSQSVELAGQGVTLDPLIETRSIEPLEPGAEFCVLIGR